MWADPSNLKVFCEFCAAQVLEGNMTGGSLNKEAVDAVIMQLGEMGKVVSPLQIKNKWDHLRGLWKVWKQIWVGETGLGYDADTGKIEASAEWWKRKIEECPKAKTIKNKGLLNVKILEIMFEGTVATGKNAWAPSGQLPNHTTEGYGDSSDSQEFVDPQCEATIDVDPMDLQIPSVSRAGLSMNKGKGLAKNVQLFKGGVSKRRSKHRSAVQEMSDSLKNMTEVLMESRSVSGRTPSVGTPRSEIQQVMDSVIGLSGVQLGDRLYAFNSLFFMGNQEARQMFLALEADKNYQLKWLEKQYEAHNQFW